MPERPGINTKIIKLAVSNQNITFNSDFESGNLDVVVKINDN